MAVAATNTDNPTREDFTALLNESFKADSLMEGGVIKGIIVAIERDLAVIDVGLKTEGRVALKEFALPGREANLKVGDEVVVDSIVSAGSATAKLIVVPPKSPAAIGAANTGNG